MLDYSLNSIVKCSSGDDPFHNDTIVHKFVCETFNKNVRNTVVVALTRTVFDNKVRIVTRK